MNKADAISNATVLAYEEDAVMIVGKIQGEWVVAHNEDAGRIAQMTDVVEVDAAGVREY